MFLLSNEILAITLLLVCIIPIAILIILALVLRIKNSKLRGKKIEEEEVSDAFKDDFHLAFGGKENISKVEIERNKVKVFCNDIEKINTDKLKELGAENVLIIGNEVRCNFADRAEYVYNILK